MKDGSSEREREREMEVKREKDWQRERENGREKMGEREREERERKWKRERENGREREKKMSRKFVHQKFVSQFWNWEKINDPVIWKKRRKERKTPSKKYNALSYSPSCKTEPVSLLNSLHIFRGKFFKTHFWLFKVDGWVQREDGGSSKGWSSQKGAALNRRLYPKYQWGPHW